MTGALVGLGVLETALHARRRDAIPVRVHVNGTRGKSSVCRLIGAGLRAGGRTTCTKTTGTLARFILPDGRERPVFRPARANVIEQVRIVAAAAAAEAEALVLECMALQPTLQWLSEDRLVRATHAIITNARPDHLDVMGPGEADVARALAGMIPVDGVLYTAERDHLDFFAAACADRGARLVTVTAEDVAHITDADLDGFAYTEHAENLALALRVCEDLDVPRAVALAGMWAATPDPGAMTEHALSFFGRRLVFVNGFAANDPESTEYIWRKELARHDLPRHIAVFNCRADRPDRSRQLGQACAAWPHVDEAVLIGSGTYMFARAAVDAGFPPERIHYCEGRSVEEVFETVLELVGAAALVMGMGNIGGPGLEVVRYFRNRATVATGAP